jgi:hypothetical protein
MERLARDLLAGGVTADIFSDVSLLGQYHDWEAATIAKCNRHLLSDQLPSLMSILAGRPAKRGN